MLVNIAYTTKRKHTCSILLRKFGVFQQQDSIAMLFLHLLSLSKADAKIHTFRDMDKIIYSSNLKITPASGK